MILPDTLKPLPVAPPDEPASSASHDSSRGFSDGDAFVSERSVRQLLLGPMVVAGAPGSRPVGSAPASRPPVGLKPMDEDSFAGPTLIPLDEPAVAAVPAVGDAPGAAAEADGESPFIVLAKGQSIRRAPKPDYRPGDRHPALEENQGALPPCPRRGAVNRFRRRVPRSPKVWLAAAAAATLAFLATATMVDFVARKAAQQFGMSTEPVPITPAPPSQAAEPAAPSLASRAR